MLPTRTRRRNRKPSTFATLPATLEADAREDRMDAYYEALAAEREFESRLHRYGVIDRDTARELMGRSLVGHDA